MPVDYMSFFRLKLEWL